MLTQVYLTCISSFLGLREMALLVTIIHAKGFDVHTVFRQGRGEGKEMGRLKLLSPCLGLK